MINQKRLSWYCACILHLLIAQSWAQNSEAPLEISELTNQVQTRYYFIKRLDKTIKALYHVHMACEQCIPQELIAHLKTINSFENQMVQTCLKNITVHKSLRPIFACWQAIITYKHISDSTLCLEFSQLLHTLVHKLVAHTKTKTDHIKQLRQLNFEIENPLASTHQVSFRFYILKRLMHVPAFFEAHRNITVHKLPQNLVFVHPQTARCYMRMQSSYTIEPLENLFDEVQQYRFIDDSIFIQEFLQLIFIAITCIDHEIQGEHQLSHSFEHVIALSVNELLEAIDIMINKVHHLEQKKERNIPFLLEENFDFNPNHFANYVHRRFYFIERLERIVTLFQEINRSMHVNSQTNQANSALCKTSFDPETMFDFNNSFQFNHNKIRESIRSMEHEHNFKPLFSVWNEFITYKSIEDQLFVEEFTKEIFVISRNILIACGICARDMVPLKSLMGLEANQLLDVIDTYVDQFLEQKPEYSSPHIQSTPYAMRVSDLHQSVHIDEVIMRFYHIKRLEFVFWILNMIQEKEIPINLSYTTTPEGLFLDSKYHFKHEHIVSCIRVMEQTNSIEPLKGLMLGVQRYKYINDERFKREYLFLLLITLQHLELRRSISRIPLDEMSSAEEIPLEKILDALDLIVEELPLLLEKYEFNTTQNVKEWVKHHWWAPAIILGTIGIKLYLIFRKSGQTGKPSFQRPSRPSLNKPSRPSLQIRPETPIDEDEIDL